MYVRSIPGQKSYIANVLQNWVGGFMFSRPGRHDLKLWGAGHMSSVPVAAFDPIFWLHHW